VPSTSFPSSTASTTNSVAVAMQTRTITITMGCQIHGPRSTAHRRDPLAGAYTQQSYPQGRGVTIWLKPQGLFGSGDRWRSGRHVGGVASVRWHAYYTNIRSHV
jgi:hypothetical protein